MATSVDTKVQPAYAVLDGEGHVVMLVAGSGAAAAVDEWAERGYRVVALED